MPTIKTLDRETTSAAPATGTRAEDADIALAARLAGQKDHPAMRALGALSQVGDQPPLFALCSAVVAYGFVAGDRRATIAGARMLGSFLVATWIKSGLKRLVSRTRPNVLLDEGRYEVRPLGPDEGPWHSFPSGHTAGSVAVARAVARVYSEARAPAYGAAAAIALIQLPRGAHYPSDVAAGVLIGLGAEAAIDGLARAFPARQNALTLGTAGEKHDSARGAAPSQATVEAARLELARAPRLRNHARTRTMREGS